MAVQPIIADPSQGQAVWHGDALWQFKATTAETDGRFWLAHLTAAKGWGSPVHMHTREDETFLVIEGELRVKVGDMVTTVPAGSVAVLPRDIPHAYRVDSDTARFHIVGTPGGFDEWFIKNGEAASSLTLPPPATEPPDYPAYVASLQEYGVQFIGPPPSM